MKFKFNLVIGSLLIVVALLFILSTAGLLPAELSKCIISWQALIAMVGIVSLFLQHFINAALFLVTGTYFLIPHLYAVYKLEMPVTKSDLTSLFIASLLIVGGVALIFGTRKIRHRGKSIFDIKPNKNGLPQISCAFGQTNHTVIEKPFKGAAVSTAFGETTINMGKTTLPEGDSYLEVNTAFGATVILVPESWRIQTAVQSFFGGVSDKREHKPSESSNRLVIRGAVAFGGIEIHSLQEEIAREDTQNEETIESISVKHNNRIHIIALEELHYIQADGDYVTLCTAQGKFLKEQTMKYFQNALPSDQFIRIHRSYIVNLSEISSVDCRGKEIYYVSLKDDTSLRASITGYQALKERLEI